MSTAETTNAIDDHGAPQYSPEELAELERLAAEEAQAPQGDEGDGDGGDAPPDIPIVSSSNKPKKKRGRKKKAAAGASPDVGPPVDTSPSPPFEGGPPEDREPDPVDVAPTAAPAVVKKKKRRIDPKKLAHKATEALDGAAQFVAARRYGDLAMQVPAGDGSLVNVPIAGMAAATAEEKAEIEAALAEVVEGWGIELSPEVECLFVVLFTYGRRAYAMEKTAVALHGHLRTKPTAEAT
jgi:hypothetical protein